MAQKNIDFGTFPEDPDADAIRTAFQKAQDNFTELYQVSHSTGVASITAGHGLVERNHRTMGDILLDSKLPNVTIQTGTSLVTGVNQVVTGNIASIADSNLNLWLDVSDTITTSNAILANLITGNANITGNVTSNLLPNGTLNLGSSSQKWNNTFSNNTTVTSNISTGNITVGNLATATYFTGTLTTNAQPNITSLGTLVSVNVTGNAVAGNLITGGYVHATGNIVGPNVNITNTLDASGSIGGAAGGALTVSGGAYIAKRLNVGQTIITANILASDVTTAALDISGNINWSLGTKIYSTIQGSLDIYSSGPGWSELNYADKSYAYVENAGFGVQTNAQGTLHQWWFRDSGLSEFPADANVTGNIVGKSNIISLGKVIASGNVSGTNIIGTGNITGVHVTASGNVTAANFLTSGNLTVAKVTASGNLAAANTSITGTLDVTGDFTVADITSSGDLVIGDITSSGDLVIGDITSSGGLDASGAITGASISVTGNASAQNMSLTGLATITGNLSSGNLSTGRVTATGNISGANITAAGSITATGNITAGNLNLSSALSASSLVLSKDLTVANITASGKLDVTGNASFGHVTGLSFTTGGNITGDKVTATYFYGIGSQLTNISASEVTGTVGTANYAVYSGTATTASRAATVTTNAQPNVTSVGTLTSLNVSGNVSTSGLTSSAFIIQSVEMAMSAAGSTQGTAKPITKQINMITTAVASSSDGILLPPAVPGLMIAIMNQTNVSLKVYPSSGQMIEALTTNAPYSLVATQRKHFIAMTNDTWYLL